MTDNEVNEIIAEYIHSNKQDRKRVEAVLDILNPKDWGYIKSIDSLVPVWEKLHYTPQFKRRTGKKGWIVCGKQSQLEDVYGSGDTIQQAAAHATAKAILELYNE